MTTSMKVLCNESVPPGSAVAAVATSASSSSLPLDAPPSFSSFATWVGFPSYASLKSVSALEAPEFKLDTDLQLHYAESENSSLMRTLALAAATAAASDILLLRLASARTPRSTRSEIRLRRELLTRAVHTESRRLILCRACEMKGERDINSHSNFLQFRHLNYLQLRSWACTGHSRKNQPISVFSHFCHHHLSFCNFLLEDRTSPLFLSSSAQ